MAKISLILKLAIIGILTNKLRSFLTILGIIIGIASVIILSSIGRGAQEEITGTINSLGINLITVIPGQRLDSLPLGETADSADASKEDFSGSGNRNGGGPPGAFSSVTPLTLEDYYFLRDNLDKDLIKNISPNTQKTDILNFYDKSIVLEITCVSEDFLDISGSTIKEGNNFSYDDINSSSNNNKAVLGYSGAKKLIGADDVDEFSDLIGKTIKYNGNELEIIGVMNEKESSSFNDPNFTVLVPYTYCEDNITKSNTISTLAITSTSEDNVDEAVKEIDKKLLSFKNETESEASFSIFTPNDIIEAASQITGIFTLFLTSIAGISLLVGGIGISNIMLVSITERTKEIGLRKALGAKNADILGQFLTEAIFLTFLGGLLGVGLAWIGSRILSGYIGFDPIFSPDIILLATGISIGIGLLFGFAPAWKASRMTPVDALRME